MMVGKTAHIRKADRERFELMGQIGCIPCRKDGRGFVAAQVNHLLNGYRIGHQATVGECPWHHMGQPLGGLTCRQTREIMGPSRALEKRNFHRQYGTDEELLAQQNRLLELARLADEMRRNS